MKYRFSDSFLEDIRDKNDIESVISSYVDLKRRGHTLTGLCPFHNEKTPSFTVYPETSSYYCFGCGAGGDVITFIRSVENLDYIEAVKLLADRSGVAMPEASFDDSVMTMRKRIFEANRAAAKFFNETLFTEKGKGQLEYLVNRKLTKQTITHFGLGAAPDDWYALGEHLEKLGFNKNELVAANLVRTSEKNGKKYYYDAFRNKVMFPVIDLRGNVVAFGGRVLDNSKPKYINTSDTLVYKKSNELFALNFAKNGNSRKLVLCEGYMDVITLHQSGFTNAVAGLGTALTPEQVSLISRYADEVSLCYDSDEAGQKAVRAAITLFSKTGVNVKVIRLSGGKDPDEIIKTHGKERFRSLLESADNDIEYKLSKAKENYITETSDGKIKYLQEAVKILASSDYLTRDVYAMRLSDELDVSKDAILSQIQQAVKREKINRQKNAFQEEQKHIKSIENAIDPERVKNIRAAKAEDVILITLLNNASFYKAICSELTEELFITPLNNEILKIVCERLEEGLPVDISYLSQYFTHEKMSAVARLFANKNLVSNTVDECRDCIKVLKDERKKREKKDVSQMTDEDFLAFFSSKKTEDENK